MKRKKLMLILTRRIGESINIGDNVTVRVLGYNEGHKDQIRIGIEAPTDVKIIRPDAVCKDKRIL